MSWCLLAVEMILSKQDGNVAWELNELLAADRRARAFNNATIEGLDTQMPPGFEAVHWEQIGKEALEKALLAEQEAQSDLAENTDVADTVHEEAADTPAPFDLEAELQARYEEGLADGQRIATEGQQAEQEADERIITLLEKRFDELPPVWPTITDLALDIAQTVCLRSLSVDPAFFKEYVVRALESAELPKDLPIEIRVSQSAASLFDQEALSSRFPEQNFSISVGAELDDGDISIAYDQITVDRLLEREFEQLREQLIAQFPDQNRSV